MILAFYRIISICYNIYGANSNYLPLQSPYHASCDTAFGAKKDQGQKVVFLGALKDIPFKEKEELDAEAHDLDWSTSALPEDMILEMKKQDLLLATRKEEGKDEDATEDAKMKDSGSKKAKSKRWWDAKKDAKKRKEGVEKDRENKDMGVEKNDEEKLYGTREPTDPKHAAEKENLKKGDNGKQESLDTEDSLAKDVEMEDTPLRSAELDVLPDADSTPGHGSVED